MPNWFNAEMTITGSEENMKPIYEWAKSFDVETDNDIEEKSFNRLVPLPTKDGEWDWDIANKYWRSKWGVAIVRQVIVDKTEVYVCFDSAWSSPVGLFYQLEKKYDVKVESQGSEQEGCWHIVLYENGKYKSVDYDLDGIKEYANLDDGVSDDDDEFDSFEYDDFICDYVQWFICKEKDDKDSWEDYDPTQ